MAITITQTGSSLASLDLGFTAVAGRTLLGAVSQRDWDTYYVAGGGWTQKAAYSPNTIPKPPSYLIGKVAAGGETAVGGSFPAIGSTRVVGLELTGVDLTTAVGGSSSGTTGVGGPYTMNGPTLTPTAGAECIIIVSFAFSRNEVLATPSGWTLAGSRTESDWPIIKTYYRMIASASGSYTASVTEVGDNIHFGAAGLILYAGAAATGFTQAFIL